MGNVTKRELVEHITQETGQTHQEISAALAQGRHIEFRNFGVFEIKVTKARVGRNPKAPQDEMTIPARVVVKFRAGLELSQRVNQCSAERGRKTGEPG